MKLCWYSFIVCFMLSGCALKEGTADNNISEYQNLELKYAKGFSISADLKSYRVSIKKPFKGAEEAINYIFYKGDRPEMTSSIDAYVQVPVKSMVCTSTTHLPLLDYLNKSQVLVGFPTLDYISSTNIRRRIDAGQVEELGIDEALNIEKLVSLKPDMVMAYSLSGDLGQFGLIAEADIPVIINAEYLEPHPLGRAEWIKLAGILLGKEKEADSIFNSIEKEYLDTKALVNGIAKKPKVLSGIVYGESWFLPGGKNYASVLLGDAGFEFFWAEDTTSAFLPLSFETVFEQSKKADFWIGVASYRTLEEMAAADSRYINFDPYINKNVYSYNKRIGAKGGSEFLELGYLRPDIILKDLVKIGHPELLLEHNLFFHFKLED